MRGCSSTVVKKELIEIKDKYGDERQTEIVDEVPRFSIEDMIRRRRSRGDHERTRAT